MDYDEELQEEIEDDLNHFFWLLAEEQDPSLKVYADRAKKIWQDFKGLGYALEKHYEEQNKVRIVVNAEQVAKNISNLQQKMVEKRKKNKNVRR